MKVFLKEKSGFIVEVVNLTFIEESHSELGQVQRWMWIGVSQLAPGQYKKQEDRILSKATPGQESEPAKTITLVKLPNTHDEKYWGYPDGMNKREFYSNIYKEDCQAIVDQKMEEQAKAWRELLAVERKPLLAKIEDLEKINASHHRANEILTIETKPAAINTTVIYGTGTGQDDGPDAFFKIETNLKIEDSEREEVRAIISHMLGEIADDRITVSFKDECSVCGRQAKDGHAKGCPEVA